jgi:hypothetical protein
MGEVVGVTEILVLVEELALHQQHANLCMQAKVNLLVVAQTNTRPRLIE